MSSTDLQSHFEAYAAFGGPRACKAIDRKQFINICKDLELKVSDADLEQLFAGAQKDEQNRLPFQSFSAQVMPQLAQRAGLSLDELTTLFTDRSPKKVNDANVVFNGTMRTSEALRAGG
jgi:hypothetical protein